MRSPLPDTPPRTRVQVRIDDLLKRIDQEKTSRNPVLNEPTEDPEWRLSCLQGRVDELGHLLDLQTEALSILLLETRERDPDRGLL